MDHLVSNLGLDKISTLWLQLRTSREDFLNMDGMFQFTFFFKAIPSNPTLTSAIDLEICSLFVPHSTGKIPRKLTFAARCKPCSVFIGCCARDVIFFFSGRKENNSKRNCSGTRSGKCHWDVTWPWFSSCSTDGWRRPPVSNKKKPFPPAIGRLRSHVIVVFCCAVKKSSRVVKAYKIVEQVIMRWWSDWVMMRYKWV